MRVVIGGAGIAGPTLANRLVSAGHDVVLLEGAPIDNLRQDVQSLSGCGDR
jgi:2-polyprenyl-6-methoxyphenol hydroxylase-like FAD-dependent oxidoreductase